MQQLPQPLADHLAGPDTTLAICWRIQRVDGVLLGFTQHDRDIYLDGIRHRSAPAFSLSEIQTSAGLATDNLDVSGVFSHDALTAEDLELGRYDNARLDIFKVNWQAPEDGRIELAYGVIGRVTRRDEGFEAELRGLKHLLGQSVGAIYTPDCRARLGDKACRVNLRLFRHETQIVEQLSATRWRMTLTSLADDYLNFGTLRWRGGPLAGQDQIILRQTGAIIDLDAPPVAPVSLPVRVDVIAGCDRRLSTCRDKFSNVLNYRGEPYVPGTDALYDYPSIT